MKMKKELYKYWDDQFLKQQLKIENDIKEQVKSYSDLQKDIKDTRNEIKQLSEFQSSNY